MEILVLGIAEILVVPVVTGMIFAVDAAVLAVSGILRVFFLPVEVAMQASLKPTADSKTEDKADDASADRKAKKDRRRKIANRVILVSGIVIFALLLTVLVVNAFFFQPATRLVLGYVESKTDIEIAFDKAEGNLWTGRIQLHGVTVKRRDHPVSCFDLKADLIALDVSVPSLISPRGSFKTTVVESLKISGMEGKWDQYEDSQDAEWKKRRNFRIEHMALDDLRFDYTDHTRPKKLHVELAIDHLESRPFRSYLALFDLLFRSNIRGSINGTPYKFETDDLEKVTETRWECKDLPVDIPASCFGTPFDWFDSGKIDFLIVNRWNVDEIVMDWNLTFRDFHAKAPEGTSLVTKAKFAPLLLFMNRHAANLPLRFKLELNQEENRLDSSPQWMEFMTLMFGEKIGDALKEMRQNGPDENAAIAQ